MKPARILYELKDELIEIEQRVKTIYEIDMSEQAVQRMILEPPVRFGLSKHDNGRFYFREGLKGSPLKIGKYITDGYDYVFEYYGRLYITHNKAIQVLRSYRYNVVDDDEKIIREIEQKYNNYLDTLL